MAPSLSTYPLDSKVRRAAVKQTVRLEALRHVGLFKGMSKRSLTRINQMSEVRMVAKGEIIVAEGDPGSDAMVVLEGTASGSASGGPRWPVSPMPSLRRSPVASVRQMRSTTADNIDQPNGNDAVNT